MLNLGVVQQGGTIRIPFWTITGDNPPIPVSPSGSWVDGDFEFYKDGVLTTITGTAITPSTDIDTTPVGRHRLVIDLTGDADFTAGSTWECWLAPATTTVDAAAVNVCIGLWTIETDAQKYARVFGEVYTLATTIATLSSQVSFTLTDGFTENDVPNGWLVLFRDSATALQRGWAVVDDYVASTKTVTLRAGAQYTVAAGDYIAFMPSPDPSSSWVRVKYVGNSTILTGAGTVGDSVVPT